MIMKRRIAEEFDPLAEFLERPGLPRMRRCHFDTLQEIERLEARPVNFLRMGPAILFCDAEQVGSHVAEREVTPYVGCGHLLGQRGTIESRENPLRKIVRIPLRKEVVAPQALKCMVEDRRVAALLQAVAQFTEGRGRLISDLREIGNRDKPEWILWLLHESSSSNRSRKAHTSSGFLSRKRAFVRETGPTRTVIPRRSAMKAGSSVKSSPT